MSRGSAVPQPGNDTCGEERRNGELILRKGSRVIDYLWKHVSAEYMYKTSVIAISRRHSSLPKDFLSTFTSVQDIAKMRSMFGRGRPLQVAIYACCLSAFLFFGYDQGVFGGILENPHWLKQFNDPAPVITGITVSSYVRIPTGERETMNSAAFSDPQYCMTDAVFSI